MFCKKCGNQVADDAKFCPKCGEAFGTRTVAQATPMRSAGAGVDMGMVAAVLILVLTVIGILAGLFAPFITIDAFIAEGGVSVVDMGKLTDMNILDPWSIFFSVILPVVAAHILAGLGIMRSMTKKPATIFYIAAIILISFTGIIFAIMTSGDRLASNMISFSGGFVAPIVLYALCAFLASVADRAIAPPEAARLYKKILKTGAICCIVAGGYQILTGQSSLFTMGVFMSAMSGDSYAVGVLGALFIFGLISAGITVALGVVVLLKQKEINWRPNLLIGLSIAAIVSGSIAINGFTEFLILPAVMILFAVTRLKKMSR